MWVCVEKTLTPEVLEEIKSVILVPRKRLYIYGRIEHKDIFGILRWTNYCYYFEPMPTGSSLEPVFSERGNETDVQDEQKYPQSQ